MRRAFGARWPGRSVDRGARPLPGRVEIAAIELDERGRGLADRVRLFRKLLTTRVRKPRASRRIASNWRISTAGVVVEA